MSSKEVADAFYTQYPLEIHDYPQRFEKIASLCSGKVLDIACGTGTLSKYWAGSYLGIDISEVAIKSARENRRKDAKFDVADITKSIAIISETYDTIVLGEFLEHVKDDTEIFKNLEGWSKIGTKWIISVPNGDRIPDPDHVRMFTVPELRKKLSIFGRVKFYNWHGAQGRIMCSVEVGKFNEPYIGLALMAWNEEKGLERAILSCLDLVDEIVISIDTKTTDKSREIAKRYADTYKEHKWKNDFSGARNWTHTGMKSQWILFLDGHEYISEYPDIYGKLSPDQDGYMIKVVMENGGHFFYPRIYKNGIQFKNRIHNLIQTEKVQRIPNFTIIHDRIHGLAPEQREARNKQRARMMPWIFTWNLIKNPNDTRSRYYLARYYQDAKKWNVAIRHYVLYLEKSTNEIEAFQASYQAHICALAMNNEKRALEFLEHCDRLVPMRWETMKRRGLIYIAGQKWPQAIINLAGALNEMPDVPFDSPEPKNDGETLERLGFAFFQIGMHKEAKEAWERALKLNPPKSIVLLLNQRIQFLNQHKQV